MHRKMLDVIRDVVAEMFDGSENDLRPVFCYATHEIIKKIRDEDNGKWSEWESIISYPNVLRKDWREGEMGRIGQIRFIGIEPNARKKIRIEIE